MYRVVVRAKKDADAVRAMLSRYYGGWDVEVVTLGGVREPEKAAERLAELADGSNYVIVLLGRDDTPLAELAARAPPTAVFKQLKYAKVRNSRLMALHAELEKARAARADESAFDERRGWNTQRVDIPLHNWGRGFYGLGSFKMAKA